MFDKDIKKLENLLYAEYNEEMSITDGSFSQAMKDLKQINFIREYISYTIAFILFFVGSCFVFIQGNYYLIFFILLLGLGYNYLSFWKFYNLFYKKLGEITTYQEAKLLSIRVKYIRKKIFIDSIWYIIYNTCYVLLFVI